MAAAAAGVSNNNNYNNNNNTGGIGSSEEHIEFDDMDYDMVESLLQSFLSLPPSNITTESASVVVEPPPPPRDAPAALHDDQRRLLLPSSSQENYCTNNFAWLPPAWNNNNNTTTTTIEAPLMVEPLPLDEEDLKWDAAMLPAQLHDQRRLPPPQSQAQKEYYCTNKQPFIATQEQQQNYTKLLLSSSSSSSGVLLKEGLHRDSSMEAQIGIPWAAVPPETIESYFAWLLPPSNTTTTTEAAPLVVEPLPLEEVERIWDVVLPAAHLNNGGEGHHREYYSLMHPLGLPIGFKFEPTDEELVLYFLNRKIADPSFEDQDIKEADIYKFHPVEIIDGCTSKFHYFFTKRKRKHEHGMRAIRQARGGISTWKATCGAQPIYATNSVQIGFKTSLVYYEERQGKGAKTNWIMHEFRSHVETTTKLYDWTICRIYKRVTKRE